MMTNQRSQKYSRRKFIAYIGKGLLTLSLGNAFSGCVTFPRYLGGNPNFRGPGYCFHTFKQAVYSRYGWTPGIAWWDFPHGTPIVASARGKAIGSGKHKKLSNRAGGKYFYLMHTDDLNKASRFHPGFVTGYFHLEELVSGKLIFERGETIGFAGQEGVKLVIKEHGNLVNPDDFGQGHSYLDYWDNHTNLEVTNIFQKSRHQVKLLKQLHEAYLGRDKEGLLFKIHKKGGWYGTCFWSVVETWRYMITKGPDQFTISEHLLSEMNDEFIANQPLIASFPFQKP